MSEANQDPRRFYETVTTAETGDGAYEVRLDDKPVRTPLRASFAIPSKDLAEAIAAEWQGQGERIAVRAMTLTRLANTALDRVAPRREEVIGDLVAYGGSDLICYRADHPDGLVARQRQHWDPLVAWADEAIGAQLCLIEGVIHQPQPDEAMDAVRARLEAQDEFALAGLHNVATLTGSLVIALGLHAGHLGAQAAWTAAHVDEDWQIEQWGRDEEAASNRDAHWREMKATARFLSLLR